MIRTLSIISKATMASAAFLALAGMAQAATKVGIIGAHNGTITVLDEAGESRSVKNGDAIYLNETVNTGDASSAQIMFLDRSALTVSPGSSIKVDTFVFDPKATSGNKMTMQGAKGAFRFIGGALSKKEPVEIKTPVATIGIRGGIGDVHHQQGSGTTGIVLFGEGSMTPSGGSPTPVPMGQGAQFNGGGQGPVMLSSSQIGGFLNNSPVNQAANTAPQGGSTPGLNDALGGFSTEQTVEQQEGQGAVNNSGGFNSGSGSTSNDAQGEGDGENNQQSSNGNSNNANTDGTSGNDSNTAGGSTQTLAFNDGGETGIGTGLNTADVPTDGSNEENRRNTTQEIAEDPTVELPNRPDDFPTDPTDPTNPTDGDDDPTTPTNPTDPTDPNGPTDGDGDPIDGDDDPTEPTDPNDGDDDTPPPPPPPPPPTPANGAPSAVNDIINMLDDDMTSASINVLSNDTDPDSDALTAVVGNYAGTYGVLNVQSDGTTTYTLDSDVSVGAGMTLTDTIDYDANDGITTSTADVTITVTGQDYFGNTTLWSDTAPSLPAAAEYKGYYAFKDEGAGGVSEKGTLEGYINGTDIDILMTRDDGALDSADYTIAAYNAYFGSLTSGPYGAFMALSNADVFFEEENGEVYLVNNFYSRAYRSYEDSFRFYDVKWDDDDTGEVQHVRSYIVSSPLQDNLTDIATARSLYDSIIGNNAVSIYASNGVVEYDFLPEMHVSLSSSSTDRFGFFNYNALAGFEDGSLLESGYGSSNGVFVDYQRMKFFGGYIDFVGDEYTDEPGMIATFGNVNPGTDALATGNLVGGFLNGGSALSGKVYNAFNADDNLSSIIEKDEFYVTNGTMEVKADLLGVVDDTNKLIEGMLLEANIDRDGSTLQVKQPLAIGDGASTLQDLTAQFNAADINHEGFSAGLAVAEDGTISRIKADDLAISLLNSNSSIAGAMNVWAVDADLTPSQAFNTAAQTTVSVGTNSAVIQKDMYAADILTSGGLDNGAIMAAPHNAAQAVCSTCEFAHWGVWSAEGIDNDVSGTPDVMTGLVPYVAGEVTQNFSSVVVPQNIGTVTYTGQAAGNFAIEGGGVTEMINEVGTLNANVDLTNRTIAGGDLNVAFSGVQLQMQNTNALNIAPTGAATFSGDLDATFTDSLGYSNGSQPSVGSTSGATFGPNAEEIGGYFHVQTDSIGAGGPGETITGGGIYLGERP